jgi:uncharacterized protein (DUF4213/DUF364 family)
MKMLHQKPMFETVLDGLPDGEVIKVCIGLHWTAVVMDVLGERRCGLASTLADNHAHGVPDVPKAGQLEQMKGLELAEFVREESLSLASVGVAAINALLPQEPERWKELNAEEVIAEHGNGKSVALVGHFPFISRLRSQVRELNVLEQQPLPGDFPASFAGEIIPKADVISVTGTTLINHTLDELLALCSPDAVVILLGPSTFLSPILFDYGIDLLCGSIVTDIEPVITTIQQGGNFRQVHHAGVRLVSMSRREVFDGS